MDKRVKATQPPRRVDLTSIPEEGFADLRHRFAARDADVAKFVIGEMPQDTTALALPHPN